MIKAALLETENAGWLGNGSSTDELVSMRTRVAMVGLLLGSSSTHKSPIWMHLITSSLQYEFLMMGSSKSRGSPFVQCFQACSHAWCHYAGY